MRITNRILYLEALAALQKNLQAVDQAREWIATGTRIRRASDDPGAIGAVLRADSQVRALAQYRRNIAAARSRLQTEELVLSQLTENLTRAKEIGLAQAGSTANAASRAAAKEHVDRILEQIIQAANTRFDGKYLFGGHFADQVPLDPTGAFDPTRPPAGAHQVEIGANQVVRTNHDALEIFIQSGVIDALQQLSAGLGADDDNAIRGALDLIETAFHNVQALLGDVGARSLHLDIAEANLDALEVNLLNFRAELAEVEFEEAVTTLVQRQTAYQAALLATSRILTTTLVDYLR